MNAQVHSIAIVGCGGIGSRYLQGLSFVTELSLEIFIVEPDDYRFAQAVKIGCSSEECNHTVRRVSFAELLRLEQLDICCVTTPSMPRRQIVEEISSNLSVKNWILEKVLVPSLDDLNALQDLLSNQRAWVNLPRRLYPIYLRIKDQLAGDAPIQVSVQWANFDLACNAIHLIDLIAWLCGEELKSVEVLPIGPWRQTKRADYKEFDGRISCEFENGSSLTIDNTRPTKNDEFKIVSGEQKIFVSEHTGELNAGTIEHYQMPFQSQLMETIVHELLDDELASRLTPLSESTKHHRAFLSACLQSPVLQTSNGIVPIT